MLPALHGTQIWLPRMRWRTESFACDSEKWCISGEIDGDEALRWVQHPAPVLDEGAGDAFGEEVVPVAGAVLEDVGDAVVDPLR